MIDFSKPFVTSEEAFQELTKLSDEYQSSIDALRAANKELISKLELLEKELNVLRQRIALYEKQEKTTNSN